MPYGCGNGAIELGRALARHHAIVVLEKAAKVKIVSSRGEAVAVGRLRLFKARSAQKGRSRE